MRGIKTLKRSARLIRSRFVSGSLVLLYHRIAEPANDPFSMNVSPAHFAEHLEIIRQAGQPLTLDALVDAVERRTMPARGIVVTFDDGYADNMGTALPLLEKSAVPATIFITSGLIGSTGECWWDVLARLVFGATQPSRPLPLVVDGRTREFRSANRESLLRSVHQVLRIVNDEQRRPLLESIVEWAGVSILGAGTHRPLSVGELEGLAACPMIDIGGHTVTHPVLARLPEENAIRELSASKKTLEEVTGRAVTTFAYPYGLASDYTRQTIGLVRRLGYRAACTAVPDVVWRGTNPFELPRLWVDDWSADVFARKLAVWLGT